MTEKQQIGFSALRSIGTGGTLEYLKYKTYGITNTFNMEFGTAVHKQLAGVEYDFTQKIPDAANKARLRDWKPEEIEHVERLVCKVKDAGLFPEGEMVEREKKILLEREHFVYRSTPDVIDYESKTIWDYKTTSPRCMGVFDKDKACRLIQDYYTYAQLAYYSMIVKEVDGWFPERFKLIFLNANAKNAKNATEFDTLLLEVELDWEWIERGLGLVNEWSAKLSEARKNNFVVQEEEYRVKLFKPKWV
jgi:hypothetical protein